MFGLPFHHLGIACDDIDLAAAFVMRTYEIVSDSGNVVDPLQNATLRLFNAGTPHAIELVAGPMVARLREQRISFYHVCYATPDLDATLGRAKAAGCLPISRPTPAVLFAGRRVAFVQTVLGLIEFVEQP